MQRGLEVEVDCGDDNEKRHHRRAWSGAEELSTAGCTWRAFKDAARTAHKWAKVGRAKWAKVGAKWAKVGAKWAKLGAKWAKLGAKWAKVGRARPGACGACPPSAPAKFLTIASEYLSTAVTASP